MPVIASNTRTMRGMDRSPSGWSRFTPRCTSVSRPARRIWSAFMRTYALDALGLLVAGAVAILGKPRRAMHLPRGAGRRDPKPC
jgi:hypothetical protein